MTRWLDDREQRTWRAFLAAATLVLEAVNRDLQRDTGIPHTYYEILVRLSEAPGRALRMGALADCSQSSRSRLSHAVARLEDRGWVRRTPCPQDGRGQVAELTEAGFAALEAAAPPHVESVRDRVLQPLDPAQQDQLREACEALLAALPPAPPGD